MFKERQTPGFKSW